MGFRFSSDDAKKKIVISVVLQVDASADLSGISCITTKAPTSGPSQSPSNGPSLLPSNEVSIFLIFYTLANLLQSFKWYPHTNISPFTLHITANAESKPISFEKSEQGAFSITIGQSDGCPNCISIKSGKLELVLLFTYCALLYRVYLLTCRIPYHTTIHYTHNITHTLITLLVSSPSYHSSHSRLRVQAYLRRILQAELLPKHRRSVNVNLSVC